MRILKDADEYIETMDWAEKTVDELGTDGAKKLMEATDIKIKDIENQPGSGRKATMFDIEKLKSVSFCLSRVLQKRRLKTFMAPGLEAIKRVKKHSENQQKRRSKRQTWNGLTREEREKRNQKIIEHFKKTPLKPSSFAQKYASKYGLKPRRVRDILSKGVGS